MKWFRKNTDTSFNKSEKIDLSNLNNINTEIKPSKINNYIENSIILKEIFWNNFLNSFHDNIDLIKHSINNFKQTQDTSKLKKNERILLENLENIQKKSLETTQILFDDIIKWFVPKNISVNSWSKKLWNNIPVLEEDFYNNCSKPWENILKELYLLSFNYITSYYNWLWNIWDKFSKQIWQTTTLDKNLQQKVNEIALKLKLNNSLEENTLRQLIFLIWLNLDSKVFDNIIANLEKWRIKIFDSAIKKLLKSWKYREQFDKEWILWDQLWFACIFENKKDLENIAKSLNNLYKNWDFISKFNDRWILSKSHNNKDTLQEHPFVNTWFIKNNLPLWELSLRFPYDKLIKDIIWNYKQNNNKQILFKDLILSVDDLNHEIYKLSQDIKILRIIFIENEKRNQWRNFIKSTNKYITTKVENIFNQIKNNIIVLLKKENISISFSDIDNNILEYIIYELLESKVKGVITDLAWEKILQEIKKTHNYKIKKNIEKRDYLKRLSNSFSLQLDNETKNKKKNSLSKYSQEIQNIFKDFKRERKIILKNAFFYNEIQENKKSLKWIIDLQIKTATALAKTFK